MDKLQGMSLRDQDESDDDSSSRLTPGIGGAGGGRAVISLGSVGRRPGRPDRQGTNSQTAARSGLRPPALPTPESAAIAAKRGFRQRSATARAGWHGRLRSLHRWTAFPRSNSRPSTGFAQGSRKQHCPRNCPRTRPTARSFPTARRTGKRCSAPSRRPPRTDPTAIAEPRKPRRSSPPMRWCCPSG